MTTPGDVRSFAHTGTNSGPSIRGTGSSNPFPSANESVRTDTGSGVIHKKLFESLRVGESRQATFVQDRFKL
jgi:hypothetical protein